MREQATQTESPSRRPNSMASNRPQHHHQQPPAMSSSQSILIGGSIDPTTTDPPSGPRRSHGEAVGGGGGVGTTTTTTRRSVSQQFLSSAATATATPIAATAANTPLSASTTMFFGVGCCPTGCGCLEQMDYPVVLDHHHHHHHHRYYGSSKSLRSALSTNRIVDEDLVFPHHSGGSGIDTAHPAMAMDTSEMSGGGGEDDHDGYQDYQEDDDQDDHQDRGGHGDDNDGDGDYYYYDYDDGNEKHGGDQKPKRPRRSAQQSASGSTTAVAKATRSATSSSSHHREPRRSGSSGSSSNKQQQQPSSSSYRRGRRRRRHYNRHQFVIRTIPSYLNLSPRASYHRLNIKHPPNEICTTHHHHHHHCSTTAATTNDRQQQSATNQQQQQPQQCQPQDHDHQEHYDHDHPPRLATSPGDTILMCCSIDDSFEDTITGNSTANNSTTSSPTICSNQSKEKSSSSRKHHKQQPQPHQKKSHHHSQPKQQQQQQQKPQRMGQSQSQIIPQPHPQPPPTSASVSGSHTLPKKVKPPIPMKPKHIVPKGYGGSGNILIQPTTTVEPVVEPPNPPYQRSEPIAVVGGNAQQREKDRTTTDMEDWLTMAIDDLDDLADDDDDDDEQTRIQSPTAMPGTMEYAEQLSLEIIRAVEHCSKVKHKPCGKCGMYTYSPPLIFPTLPADPSAVQPPNAIAMFKPQPGSVATIEWSMQPATNLATITASSAWLCTDNQWRAPLTTKLEYSHRSVGGGGVCPGHHGRQAKAMMDEDPPQNPFASSDDDTGNMVADDTLGCYQQQYSEQKSFSESELYLQSRSSLMSNNNNVSVMNNSHHVHHQYRDHQASNADDLFQTELTRRHSAPADLCVEVDTTTIDRSVFETIATPPPGFEDNEDNVNPIDPEIGPPMDTGDDGARADSTKQHAQAIVRRQIYPPTPETQPLSAPLAAAVAAVAAAAANNNPYNTPFNSKQQQQQQQPLPKFVAKKPSNYGIIKPNPHQLPATVGHSQMTNMSPESEQSSQVTSVTNCSELLHTTTTTGNTFSSDGTTVGSGGAAFPLNLDPREQQPGPSKEPVMKMGVGVAGGSHGKFQPPQIHRQTGRLIMVGGYALDFDDDDDDDYDDDVVVEAQDDFNYEADADAYEDEEVYENSESMVDQDGHLLIMPKGKMMGAAASGFGGGGYRVDRTDFAMAEGSSQDDEEKAKYEFEFETTEDDVGNDEYDTDNNNNNNQNQNAKSQQQEQNKDSDLIFEMDMGVEPTTNATNMGPPTAYGPSKNNGKLKRPNELDIGMANMNHQMKYRCIEPTSSSSGPPQPPPSPPQPSAPSTELMPTPTSTTSESTMDTTAAMAQTPTSTTSTAKIVVSRGAKASKSLPENLFRTKDDPDDDPDNDDDVDHARSGGGGSKHGHGAQKDHDHGHHHHHPPGEQRGQCLARAKSSTFTGARRCDSFKQGAMGVDPFDGGRNDLTPVQDIYSSDPSTTIDLSVPNTVIEQQREPEIPELDGGGQPEPPDPGPSSPGKRFSLEIFEKFHIFPEYYSGHPQTTCNISELYDSAIEQQQQQRKMDTGYRPRDGNGFSGLTKNDPRDPINPLTSAVAGDANTAKPAGSRRFKMTTSIRNSILKQMHSCADLDDDLVIDDATKVTSSSGRKQQQAGHHQDSDSEDDPVFDQDDDDDDDDQHGYPFRMDLDEDSADEQQGAQKQDDRAHLHSKPPPQRSIQDSGAKNNRNINRKHDHDDDDQINNNDGGGNSSRSNNHNKSASTQTSSIDMNDDDDDADGNESQTYSIENLPEDSTTSGSFMLDDAAATAAAHHQQQPQQRNNGHAPQSSSTAVANQNPDDNVTINGSCFMEQCQQQQQQHLNNRDNNDGDYPGNYYYHHQHHYDDVAPMGVVVPMDHHHHQSDNSSEDFDVDDDDDDESNTNYSTNHNRSGKSEPPPTTNHQYQPFVHYRYHARHNHAHHHSHHHTHHHRQHQRQSQQQPQQQQQPPLLQQQQSVDPFLANGTFGFMGVGGWNNYRSLPSNINHLVKQVGGDDANYLRIRFEQRQRRALERGDKRLVMDDMNQMDDDDGIFGKANKNTQAAIVAAMELNRQNNNHNHNHTHHHNNNNNDADNIINNNHNHHSTTMMGVAPVPAPPTNDDNDPDDMTCTDNFFGKYQKILDSQYEAEPSRGNRAISTHGGGGGGGGGSGGGRRRRSSNSNSSRRAEDVTTTGGSAASAATGSGLTNSSESTQHTNLSLMLSSDRDGGGSSHRQHHHHHHQHPHQPHPHQHHHHHNQYKAIENQRVLLPFPLIVQATSATAVGVTTGTTTAVTRISSQNHLQQPPQPQPPQQPPAHPIVQFNTADMFEQSSQATERDVERSEFSLQNQNSELDEDESLTFENLNNQSLSVIDEDSKGDQESDLHHQQHPQQDKRPPPPPQQQLMAYDAAMNLLDIVDRSSDGVGNLELEERDLSLEAVLREESKELERARNILDRFQRQEEQQQQQLQLQQLPPTGNRKDGDHDDDQNNNSSHNDVEDPGHDKANNTLMEETITSTTQMITEDGEDDDSSRDLLLMMQSQRSGSGLVDERTELRDERIALLQSSVATIDDSMMSGQYSDLSNEQQQQQQQLSVANRRRFELKLRQLEMMARSDHNQSHHAQIQSAQILDQNEQTIGLMEMFPKLSIQEQLNNIRSVGVERDPDTESMGNVPGIKHDETTPTVSSTYSECSSTHGGKHHSSGQPKQHQQQQQPDTTNKSPPQSILKHHPTSGGHRQHGHRHHHHMGGGVGGAVMFVPQPETAAPAASSTITSTMAIVGGDVGGADSSVAPPNCCTRCYHRHHHRHHHHHQAFGATSAATLKPGGRSAYCSGRMHSHYCPNNNNNNNNAHLLVRHPADEIIHQARARSLTRNLGGNQAPHPQPPAGVQAGSQPQQQQQQQLLRPGYQQHQHHFTCSYCGESTMPPNLPPVIGPIGQSRFKRKDVPQLSRKSFTVEDVYFDVDDEENDIGVHSESYRSSLWIYIGRKEELNIWNNLNRAVLNRNNNNSAQDSSSTTTTTGTRDDGVTGGGPGGGGSGKKRCRFATTPPSSPLSANAQPPLELTGVTTTTTGDNTTHSTSSLHTDNSGSTATETATEATLTGTTTTTTTTTTTNNNTRSESEESTASEKNFRQRYETVTHRLIHRKASIELYRRILDQTFTIDKCLTLTRDNNEFGFRIHGNRPVVVSAVEKGTSAQSKGLEVGDIIVAVNGHTVLDSSHSEVVRMAHHGHSLKLELASTAAALRAETALASENQPKVIINGYLSRFIDKLAEKCSTSRDKMTNPKLWRRRWFVLKSDACLYWYRNPKSLEPIGAISLQGYCAGMVNECLFGQEHLFRLVGYKTTRCKYLAAIDHATAVQWVKALNQNSIQYSNNDAFIENTLHNIHRNPLNFINADCNGFLWKYNRLNNNWKRRYFVLKDACLYFYADANSNTALGLFFLHGYRVQSNALGSVTMVPHTAAAGATKTITTTTTTSQEHHQQQQQQFIFEIVPSDPKYRQIKLAADSESDRKRWTYALEYSIDRWIRLK